MHGSVVSIPPAASRIPPQSIELEQAVLGAILINNDAFHRVSDFLEPRHFAEPVHRRIFELCVESIAADRAATPITLKTSLPPDEIAGLAYALSGPPRRGGDRRLDGGGLRPRNPRARRAAGNHRGR
jgi:hypothetical protein